MRRALTVVQAQQWACALTAFFAFCACVVSGELGLVLVLLFPAAIIGAALFGHRVHGKLEWLWTAGLACALVYFASRVAAGQVDAVLAAARFTALLCIHRLWRRRTQRDEILLLLLSLLLLCAGAALSAELLFGAAFIGFSVAATWAMALTHLRFEIESGRGTALLQSRRLATPRLLGALALLSVLGIAGAAVVFVTFPRVALRSLRRPSHKQPLAGLSDQVDLSLQGAIGDDPRVVLRVQLSPDPGIEHLAMHWRARGLSVWTGQGWRTAEAGQMPAVRMAPRPKRRPGGRQHIQSADIEAVAGFSDGVVLTPEGWPLAVDFKRQMTARGPSQRLYRNAAGDLFYQPIDIGDLRYVVTVSRDDSDRALLRGRGNDYPPWLKPELSLPANLDPRIAALAQRIGGAKDPVDAAAAIEKWLSGTLQYTRDLAGETRDPISNFLFKRRRGHCELFSSTMVIMLRSLGIPARNVTGYFGGERTSAGYYAVRGGDAHSWVEVYFPGAGFVTFDPTPAAERGGQERGLWAQALLAWDALQQRWRAFVIDFDLVSQGHAVARIGEVFSEAARRLSGKTSTDTRLRNLFLSGVSLFLLAAAVALWTRRMRLPRGALARRSPLGPDQRRAIALFRDARRKLQRAGIDLPRAMTASELGRVSPAANEVAASYSAARWGDAALSSKDVRRLLRDLSESLSARS
ncbi:MAG TPA: transglutaminaseTgpA domain-containing protein [Myxococcales bacterium]|jgi:hypothetical protein